MMRHASSALLLFLFLALAACAGPAPGEPPRSGKFKPPLSARYMTDQACCGRGRLPPHLTPHSGVDFTGRFGDDVLAPADGVAASFTSDPASCGNSIMLEHDRLRRFTIYCHFQEVKVQPGDVVTRGQVIGTLGDSGNAGHCRRSVGPCPIVHVELSRVPFSSPRAQPGVTFNVRDYMVGCFDPQKTYPEDKLTYPVRCKD